VPAIVRHKLKPLVIWCDAQQVVALAAHHVEPASLAQQVVQWGGYCALRPAWQLLQQCHHIAAMAVHYRWKYWMMSNNNNKAEIITQQQNITD
jgi:hypothetical protein